MYLSIDDHDFTTVYCCKCGESHRVIKQCGYRYCPACAHITRWRIRERLTQMFKLMKYRRGYMLKMLTISRQNSPNLKEGIDELYRSFRRLRQSKLWNKHIEGGLFVLEIEGQPGNWHPHLHCFIYSLRIEWEALRSQWFKASKGGTGVYIKNVSNDRAIYYVTKYVTKPGTDPEYSWLLEEAVKGRRFFQRFGSFHRIKLPKYLTARKCPNCGGTDWISEWDFRKLGIPLPSG